MSLMASGMPSSGPRLALGQARVGGFRHVGGALRRLQHIGVERARAFHGGEMGVGQFGGGEALVLQPVARRGQSERGQFTHGLRSSSGGDASASRFASSRRLAGKAAGLVAARTRKARRRLVRQVVERHQQGHFAGDAHYSTTFGTRKKLSSLIGAFLTMSCGLAAVGHLVLRASSSSSASPRSSARRLSRPPRRAARPRPGSR